MPGIARIDTGEVKQGRHHIKRRGGRRHQSRSEATRRTDHQRNAGRALKKTHFEPETTLAQHVAVIGGEQDDRVLIELAFLERRQQFRNLVVEIGDVRCIGASAISNHLGREIVIPPVRHIEEPLRMNILLRVGDWRHNNVRQRSLRVKIPIFLAGNIGIVRVCKTHRQTERPILFGSRELVEPEFGVIGDFVVIFELVGNFSGAGIRNGTEIMVPPIDPLVRFRPVRCPAEIGRVDVCRQALFKTVHLIGTNKVHLAAEYGAISCPAQIMGEGRDRGGEFGGVIIDTGFRRQLPRHEGGTRRRAERARAICV